LKLLEGQKEAATGPSESLGLKAQIPIELDAPEIEKSMADTSCSPPPMSDDIDETTVKAARESAKLPATDTHVLQLEDAGMSF
jgi:hypothetical protein